LQQYNLSGRIGCIYKITNIINNKIYIGQTIQNLKYRWNEHRLNAKNGDNYKFLHAIRKYGANNFIIEEIEKLPAEYLDEAEIKWIDYYDSYSNGYNSTLGGYGNKYIKLNENEVIEYYLKCKSAYETAEYFNCSTSPIYTILKSNNIERCVHLHNLNNDEVIKYYLECKSAYKTADFFNCGYETIYKILKKNNIERCGDGKGLRLNIKEEEVVSYYLEHKSTPKTAEYFNCHQDTIRKILHINNIDLSLHKYLDLDHNAIIEFYLKCGSGEKTAKQFNCSPPTVFSILDENSIGRVNKDIKPIYSVDNSNIRTDFNNIKEAVDYLIKNNVGINKYKITQSIVRVIKGERKTAYGFKWYYNE